MDEAGWYRLQISKPPCDALSRKQLCTAEDPVPVYITASAPDGTGGVTNTSWYPHRASHPLDSPRSLLLIAPWFRMLTQSNV